MSLTVTKTNSGINWSIPANTGRVAKQFTARVQTSTSPTTYRDIVFTQAAKAEFIQLSGNAAVVIQQSATSFSITVRTNSRKVNCEFVSNSLGAVLSSMTADGDAYTNNSILADDPGEDAEFDVVANFTCTRNAQASARATQIRFTDNGGHAVTVNVSQSADTATITIGNQSVSVPANGGSGSINVTANDTWTVETVS